MFMIPQPLARRSSRPSSPTAGLRVIAVSFPLPTMEFDVVGVSFRYTYYPAEWKDDYLPYYPRKFVRVLTGPELVDTIARVTGRPGEFQFSGTTATRVKQLAAPSDLGARRGRGEGAEVNALLLAFFQTNRMTPMPVGNNESVDIDAKYNAGWCAFTWAVFKEFDEIKSVLANAGAQPIQSTERPFRSYHMSMKPPELLKKVPPPLHQANTVLRFDFFDDISQPYEARNRHLLQF